MTRKHQGSSRHTHYHNSTGNNGWAIIVAIVIAAVLYLQNGGSLDFKKVIAIQPQTNFNPPLVVTPAAVIEQNNQAVLATAIAEPTVAPAWNDSAAGNGQKLFKLVH